MPVSAGSLRHWGIPSVDTRGGVTSAVRQVLDRWITSGTLVEVYAPAGFGKTTQLAQWAAASPHRVVWLGGGLALNKSTQLARTLFDAFADLGLLDARTIAGVPYPVPGDVARQSVFVALQRLTEPLLVVLDDVDRIADFPELPRLLELAAQAPLVRVAVTRRGTTPTSFGSENWRVASLTREQLAWTVDRAALVLSDELSGNRLPLTLAHIVAATGGRASAIRQVVIDGVGQGTSVEELRARNLLDRARLLDDPEAARTLLLYVALFISMPARMLGASAIPNAEQLLGQLVADGLVRSVRTDGRTEFGLPADDRRALRAEAELHFAGALGEIHRLAVTAFEDRPADAPYLYHLARAGHTEAALAALKTHVYEGNIAERAIDFREAAFAIDEPSLSADLEALAGRLLLAHVPPMEPAITRSTEELALLSVPQTVVDGLELRAQIIITTALILTLSTRGRPAEAKARGRLLSRALVRMPWQELREMGWTPSLLWAAQGEAELLDGNVVDAVVLAGFAQQWTAEGSNAWVRFRAGTVAAGAAAITGDILEAQRQIVQAESHYQGAGWSFDRPIYPLLFAKLVVAISDMDADAARRVSIELSALSSGSDLYATASAIAETYAELFQGDLGRADLAARRMVQAARAGGAPRVLQSLAQAANADVLLAGGRPARALSSIPVPRSSDDHSDCRRSRMARAQLALGDAVTALETVMDCADRPGEHSRYGLVGAALVRAAALESTGYLAESDAAFEEAAQLLLESPSAYPFLNLPAEALDAVWARFEARHPQDFARLQRLREPWARISGGIPVGYSAEPLSAREIDVLRELRTGDTLREIADRLFLSENTVKTHAKNVYRKLGVSSRADALVVAQQRGLARSRVA